jgi:hypothetical protein
MRLQGRQSVLRQMAVLLLLMQLTVLKLVRRDGSR